MTRKVEDGYDAFVDRELEEFYEGRSITRRRTDPEERREPTRGQCRRMRNEEFGGAEIRDAKE